MPGMLSLLPGHPAGEIIHGGERCLCTGDRYRRPRVPCEGTVLIPSHIPIGMCYRAWRTERGKFQGFRSAAWAKI